MSVRPRAILICEPSTLDLEIVMPFDALDTAQRREGQIRGRIFDAVAKAYQALPAGGAAGLDIKLLEERIAAEVADIAGGGPVRIVFREFSLR